jgi:hypothetical protein
MRRIDTSQSSSSSRLATPTTSAAKSTGTTSMKSSRRHGSLRLTASRDATTHRSLFGAQLAIFRAEVQNHFTRFTTEEDEIAEPSTNTTDSQSPPA